MSSQRLLRRTPFRPSFGKVVGPELVGREELIGGLTDRATGAWLDDPDEMDANLPACVLLFGARGSGKTASLIELRDRAEQAGMIAMHVQATSSRPFENAVHRAIRRSLKHVPWADLGNPEWDQEFTLGYPKVASVTLRRRSRDTEEAPTVEDLLAEVTELARDRETSVLLCVDELQNAADTVLEALAVSVQELVEWEDQPFHFRGAALPHFRHTRLSNKTRSFFRRSEKLVLPPISDIDARHGLQLYARDERGGRFTDEALDAAVNVVKGSPYMLQLIGHHAWLASLAPREPISLGDVEAALDEVMEIYEEDVAEDTANEMTDTEATVVVCLRAKSQPCDVVALGNEVADRCEVTPERAVKVIKQMRLRGTLRRAANNRVEVAPGSGIEHASADQLLASRLSVTAPVAVDRAAPSRSDASGVGVRDVHACNEWMPRAQARCRLARGHKGGHRSRLPS